MSSITKEKRRVNIYCTDSSSLMGYVHVDPGERTIDFINDLQEIFIVVTDAEFYYGQLDIKSFKLAQRMAIVKKETIILQKAFIKWIEEIK